MKLKLWVEVLLLILAFISLMLVFTEPFMLNWIGIIGLFVFNLPILKYGR